MSTDKETQASTTLADEGTQVTEIDIEKELSGSDTVTVHELSENLAETSIYQNRLRNRGKGRRSTSNRISKVLPQLKVERQYVSELIQEERSNKPSAEELAQDKFSNLPKSFTDHSKEFSGSKRMLVSRNFGQRMENCGAEFRTVIRNLAAKVRRRGKSGHADELINQYSDLIFDMRRRKWNLVEFDRANGKSVMMSRIGIMMCKGEYGVGCRFEHTINAYDTVEALLQLTGWHLDHLITRAMIKEALEKVVLENGEEVDFQELGRLLFGLGENLVLVKNGPCHSKHKRNHMLDMDQLVEVLTFRETELESQTESETEIEAECEAEDEPEFEAEDCDV